MQQKSSKQDSWSSLLSELGVEDPIQRVTVSDPTSERESVSEPESTIPVAVAAIPAETSESPGKVGKFGKGIIPEIPSLPSTAKPAIPKKPEKMSFFDRLASINLFGTGASEKIDPKVITPTMTEPSNFVEEILEPKKLQKVEETPKEPKDRNRPQIGAVDPWSKIATQLGVHRETARSETEPQSQKEETPMVSIPEDDIDEIPDIESMVSFRNLPPKKKKVEETVVSERVEYVSKSEPAPKKPYEPAESSPRDRRAENRRPHEERKSDKYASDKRGRRHGKPDWNTPREELKDASISDEPMELDDLDLVTPSRKERVSSFSSSLEDEETVTPKKKSRNRRSRSRKHEESHRRPDRSYADSDEFEGDFEEDFEVLTPLPEREYGPPRDVFADLIPEDATPEEPVSPHDFERGQRTRSSRARGSSFQEESPAEVAETAEESDPFAHFNKRPGRGSRVDHPRRGDRHPETVVEEKEKSGRRDASLDEEPSWSRSDSASRQHGKRGRRKPQTENEEPMDEQSQLEEQEMVQLHRNIPGWEDAILPIIESNIARHANRPNNNGRKGNRR